MKVLIACEESQEVCKAFRAVGHEAYSCDIQPCSGGHPEWHIQGNVLPLLNGDCDFWTGNRDGQGIARYEITGEWDLIIAHPPCTYLSNAGARWLYAGGEINTDRFIKGMEGLSVFLAMLNARCDKIAVENPIPSRVFGLSKPTQIIQPWMFGEPWSKKTCLWLKGLPPLHPTDIVKDYKPYCSSGSYSKSHDPKYKGASRKGGSAKSRSKTFPGIAKAMAEQWG